MHEFKCFLWSEFFLVLALRGAEKSAANIFISTFSLKCLNFGGKPCSEESVYSIIVQGSSIKANMAPKTGKGFHCTRNSNGNKIVLKPCIKLDQLTLPSSTGVHLESKYVVNIGKALQSSCKHRKTLLL